MEGELVLDPREICLRIYRTLKKRIWIIIIITLITTLISVIFNIFLVSPVYESNAKLLIRSENTAKVTDNDAALYQLLFQTCKDIAQTNKVAEIAADKVGNGTKASDLLSRTKITAESGTMVLSVMVTGSTADAAYKSAQAYSEAIAERVKSLNLPSGGIQIIDEAKLPGSPKELNVKKNIIIAILLGLLISVSLVFFLDYMDGYQDKVRKHSKI